MDVNDLGAWTVECPPSLAPDRCSERTEEQDPIGAVEARTERNEEVIVCEMGEHFIVVEIEPVKCATPWIR